MYADIQTTQTALDIFSGGSIQIGTGYNGQFNSNWSTQSQCQYFGINTPYEWNKARFGFTADQDGCVNNTNDTAIGFGLTTTYTMSTYNGDWGSGEICSSTGCSHNEGERGFAGLLFGR